MLQKFEIKGVHYVVDDSLRKYVNKKIGGLDKYISKHSRMSAHGEVFLSETQAKNKINSQCEVVLELPKQQIIIKESALNMYAAIDIVEAKLKLQLKKYKEIHETGKTQRRLFARLRRKNS